MTRAGKKITDLLARPIAFHRVLVDLTGSVTAALMLSQSLYWHRKCPDDGRESGWWYKSREEWTEETGLSRYEQETARKKLVKLGVLEEKLAGNPARLWYRLDEDKIAAFLLAGFPPTGIPPTGRLKSSQQDSGKPSSSHYTETTAEITTIPGLDPKAWSAWENYRRQIGKPLKPVSIPAAMRKLASFGHEQLDVVEQSVANGWQGLFPIKRTTDRRPDNSAPGRVRAANGIHRF